MAKFANPDKGTGGVFFSCCSCEIVSLLSSFTFECMRSSKRNQTSCAFYVVLMFSGVLNDSHSVAGSQGRDLCVAVPILLLELV